MKKHLTSAQNPLILASFFDLLQNGGYRHGYVFSTLIAKLSNQLNNCLYNRCIQASQLKSDDIINFVVLVKEALLFVQMLRAAVRVQAFRVTS
jgi:hypothetical protein